MGNLMNNHWASSLVWVLMLFLAVGPLAPTSNARPMNDQAGLGLIAGYVNALSDSVAITTMDEIGLS